MGILKATPKDIYHAYRLLLGREPDEVGFEHYSRLVVERALSCTELAKHFLESAEFRFVHELLLESEPEPRKGVITLASQACTRCQIESSEFKYWTSRLHERSGWLHRKLWEWCFITQALHERSMLAPGRNGLGFAVGTEPLSALFAALGCDVLATDLDPRSAKKGGWTDTNQNASGVEQLNERNICPDQQFAAHVRFREADMCNIPADLRDFDFLWSSCAMEHLGSLRKGMEFVLNAMECLTPGGIAVHTTELNCDSDMETLEAGRDVIYRKRDLTELKKLLEARGHSVEPLNFDLGDSDADRYVDEPPYRGKIHLKLRIGSYASTSFGLIISKSTI